MSNWVDRWHLIRRLLLAVFAYVYLNITNHIFFDGTASDTLKISAYVSFTGIITFMVKWYHDTRNSEIKGDNNAKRDI